MAQITLNSSGVASSGSLLLQTNGTTTQATVDTSGRLGLGVTPTGSWSMQIYGVGSASSGAARIRLQNSATGATDSDGGSISMEGVDMVLQNSENGVCKWEINGSERMRLDASGNLGVGVTSMNASLHVQGAATTDGAISFNQQLASTTAYNSSPLSGTMVALKYTSGGSLAGMGGWAIGKENATDGNFASYFAMYTRPNGGANTERARIDSSGNLLVGKTDVTFTTNGISLAAANYIAASRNSDVAGFFTRSGTDGSVINFQKTTTTVGSISVTGSATAYNTSSDYRLKNTIQPMTGALEKVSLLKPCTYKWNVDGSDGEGFIAHELAEVVPQCVTGEKDAVDENGNPVYQGIDTSFLVATLTAALQEAHGLIKDLQTRVAALES